MATLIPGLDRDHDRVIPARRRVAQRFQTGLDDGYVVWHDLAIGPGRSRPGFILLHPNRGLLVLECREWKGPAGRPAGHPTLEDLADAQDQARRHAQAVVDQLEQDPQLTFSSGALKGRLMLPWSHAVVVPQMTRQALAQHWGQALPEPARWLCRDELQDEGPHQEDLVDPVDGDALGERIWHLFPLRFSGHLSPAQLDRIRWHLFPELHLPRPPRWPEAMAAPREPDDDSDLFGESPSPPPDVMNLDQEQVARNLGGGHRVVHGVTGSGKTLLLGHQAVQLAHLRDRPILLLCHGKLLARRLEYWMQCRGVSGQVHVASFHAWCHQLLVHHHLPLPLGDAGHPGYYARLVDKVREGLDQGAIPAGQYDAVLVDEGQDFHPDWLALAVRMANPEFDHVLVMDDRLPAPGSAGKRSGANYSAAGIQARGRETVLRVNHRNTREILDFAEGFLTSRFQLPRLLEDGHAPHPAGARHGPAPRLLPLGNLQESGRQLALQLRQVHAQGTAWRDMAVLLRQWDQHHTTVGGILRAAGVPATGKDSLRFDPRQDTVRLLPLAAAGGLEFPLVILVGTPQGSTREEAWLYHMGLTRATRELLVLA